MSEPGARIPRRHGEGDQLQAGGGVGSAPRRTIRRARAERRSGNLPEVLLWRVLRDRRAALKFRRQHPIGPYCVDFACLPARLAIEIDGEAHGRSGRPHADARRDAYLAGVGLDTLRIPARDVLDDVDPVVRLILAACASRTPLHQPAAGPPSRSGEVSGSQP